jgi:hypothetical protein
MYADDTALFINLVKEETNVIAEILKFLGKLRVWLLTEASVLCTRSDVRAWIWRTLCKVSHA